MSKELVFGGEHKALRKRGLSAATCKKYDYKVAQIGEQVCQVANYRNNSGELMGQKLRFPGKDFRCRGDMKNPGLWGQYLFKSGGRMIVVTEGEIDALSMSQAEDNKWPVVSLPNGAKGAVDAVKHSLQ
ncbi:MAG: hypothetical protein AAGI66_06255 [Cyanobacteria bacterium P01_H01_bin.74]